MLDVESKGHFVLGESGSCGIERKSGVGTIAHFERARQIAQVVRKRNRKAVRKRDSLTLGAIFRLGRNRGVEVGRNTEIKLIILFNN